MTGLPDAHALYPDQLQGWTCVRCRRRLYRSVHIGTVTHYGRLVDLYACPECATPEEQAAQEQACSGLCAACDGWAARAVIVREVAGNSGAGWTQYAHPECAQERGWKPLGSNT